MSDGPRECASAHLVDGTPVGRAGDPAATTSGNPTAPTGTGCDPDSYSPEICCPPLFLCCQDNPGGPYVDFGSGACAAIDFP